jgi:hypothetical protein
MRNSMASFPTNYFLQVPPPHPLVRMCSLSCLFYPLFRLLVAFSSSIRLSCYRPFHLFYFFFIFSPMSLSIHHDHFHYFVVFFISFFLSIRAWVSGPVPDPLALRLPEGRQPLPQERGPDHAVSFSLFHVCTAVFPIRIGFNFQCGSGSS